MNTSFGCPRCGRRNEADAVYCSGCGWALHTAPTTPLAPSCPHCHSLVTQSVKAFCLSSVRVSGGVAAGTFGVGIVRSLSGSETAARLSPGPNPNILAGCLIGFAAPAMLFGIALAATGGEGLGAFFLVLGVLIVVIALSERRRRTPAWRAKMQMLERGWVCLQCGCSWIPTQ